MNISIVGAGPVGLLQCLFLLNRQHELEPRYGTMKISVYEKRSEDELMNVSRQRSINLALSWRGMRALEEVGLLNDVMQAAVPMRGRCIHPLHGQNHFQNYSPFPDQMIYSIQRLAIEKILLERVKSLAGSHVYLHFGQALGNVDFKTMALNFSNFKGIRTDLLIGCDGAFSQVREEFSKFYTSDMRISTFKHIYKELSIPCAAGLEPKDRLHIWPRENKMLIALPNRDGSFTATFFGDLIGSFGDVEQFCKDYPDFIEAVGKEEFIWDWTANPPSNLSSALINPLGSERTILLGDAGHSILPFYGQGMNAGFEDVQIFTEYLISAGIREAIQLYSRHRVADSRAISKLAEENFVEMSSSVLSPYFRFKTRAIQLLSEYFPTAIIPRYSMIAFTSLPYGSIKKREKIQELKLFIVIVLVLILGLISKE